MERTLVIIKADGVERGLVGRIIQRFEDAGLKILGMKMVWVDKEFAGKHYFDLQERRGDLAFRVTMEYLTEGPVVAFVLEGVEAAENVRRITGTTEPKSAAPGTIRGDFAHHTFDYADKKQSAVRNLIHASGNAEEAKFEIGLWFTPEDLHDYTTVHQKHTL